MASSTLHCVLGDPELLESGSEGCAVVIDGGVVLGRATFELVYGPYAEIAIAVRGDDDVAVADELIWLLRDRVAAHHVEQLRVAVLPGQDAFAAALTGEPPASDMLQLPVAARV